MAAGLQIGNGWRWAADWQRIGSGWMAARLQIGNGWRWAADGQRMGDGKVDGVIGILGVTKDRYNSYYA